MREAQARTVFLKDYSEPHFLVDETHLHFELYDDRTVVTSRLLMRRNPKAPKGFPLVLDGRDMKLLEVSIDGRALGRNDYELSHDNLSVSEVPERFEFSAITSIKPQENTSLEGLYRSRAIFCTQCEAEGFRKITYYPDRPDILSVFTTTIEADRATCPVLLSNGNDIDCGVSEGNSKRHWVRWHDPFPKPSYLFALVAGNLSMVGDNFTTCSGREVDLRIFVEEKDLDKCEFALISLKKAMQWDEKTYGREYDLDVFMIVAVDDFNMGAMENKGLNIFNSACVLAKPETTTDSAFERIEGIVAHEYFHNWSGNRVTCRDWFQLSLKEGFTVFRDAEFSADMGSRAVKRVEDVKFLRTIQFAEDAGPMAHSVRPESYMEISNFYTVTVYEKGAEVVRMQAQLLGPELFRKATDQYFRRYDGMAVTTEDFVVTMEEVGGLDLSQFRLWYSQAGTPELTVSVDFHEDTASYCLKVKQHCPATPGQEKKEPFFIPLAMALLGPDGNELPLQLKGEPEPLGTHRVLTVTEVEQTFEFVGVTNRPVPSLLREFSAPVKLNANLSRDDLMFLLGHDTDGFVKWEAAQQLGIQVMQDLLQARQQKHELEVDERLLCAFETLLEDVLRNPDMDRAMVAHLIQLPTEAYMAEQSETIDVDGIHQVREFLRREIAGRLKDLLAEIYARENHGGPYVFNARAVAGRALKNTALSYLALLEDSLWLEQCISQFDAADNMTDAHAALLVLTHMDTTEAREKSQQALEDFYRRWQDEALVVDQWFALQAGANLPGNLERVRQLTDHHAFDIKNPNKVRAVISAFCNGNPSGFHSIDGSGYEFLAENILTLNGINPQIAARLLTPLTRWKRHLPLRQKMMKAQLQRISETENLARDIYEVVSKSLN